MKRSVACVLLLVALVSGACGGGTRNRPRRLVGGALNRVSNHPFAFRYQEQLLKPKKLIEVRGEVADDLRSRGTLAIDGKDVLEQIISDDAIAVRVRDQKMAAPYVAAIAIQDKAAAADLKVGKWLIDQQGAPELVAPRTGDNVIQTGVNPLLESSSYIFQYLEDAMNAGRGLEEFNPDSPFYNALDDPWRDDANAGLVKEGIRRYDINLPPLPRRTQRGSGAAIPGTPHFRKLVFYLRGTRLVEVKEQIKIDDRPEFRRAAAGRAAKYYTELLKEALAGATRDPIRERRMDISFEARDDISVALPSKDFVSVQPMDLVDSVATLLPPPPRGRAVPGAPVTASSAPSVTGKPSASPSASKKPAATPAAKATPGASPSAP